jgi:hypothetical protein
MSNSLLKIAFPQIPIFKTISSDWFFENFPQMNPIAAVGRSIKKQILQNQGIKEQSLLITIMELYYKNSSPF